MNVVFEKEEDANSVLEKLSLNKEPDNKVVRLIHPINENKRDIAFSARISNSDDKKVKNAAQYSRYYLFNPKEEKRRRPRNDQNDYRERETVARRRRNNDEEDLFPSKVIEENNSPLIDRIGKSTEDNSLIDSIGETTEDKSLINRIGQANSSEHLDDDDLFKATN